MGRVGWGWAGASPPPLEVLPGLRSSATRGRGAQGSLCPVLASSAVASCVTLPSDLRVTAPMTDSQPHRKELHFPSPSFRLPISLSL